MDESNTARSSSYLEIPGYSWIDKLKYAYDESSHGKPEHGIDINQWVNSRLKYVISDTPMSDDELMSLFQIIDSDSDNRIGYEDLVAFLLIKNQGKLGNQHKVISATCIGPALYSVANIIRTPPCIQAEFIASTEEIITLNESCISFWDFKTLKLSNTYQDKGMTGFCIIRSLGKIAIIKKSRQIIFIDIVSKVKLPFIISPLIEDSSIRSMSLKQTKNIQNRKGGVPLYDTPSSVCLLPNTSMIFVGNEKGCIECFNIKEYRNEYSYELICVKQVHSDTVTNIMYNTFEGCFVSSSLDGTICFWNYFDIDQKIRVIYKYRNKLKLGITGFIYDEARNEYIYNTPSHTIGIWRSRTIEEHSIKNDLLVSAMTTIPISKSKSFLVIVTRNNNIIVFKSGCRTECGRTFINPHHEYQSPSFALTYNNFVYLVGAYVSKWNLGLNLNYSKIHDKPLIGLFVNSLTGKFYTVDTSGVLNIWGIEKGNRDFEAKIDVSKSPIEYITMDTSEKRLIVTLQDGSLQMLNVTSLQQVGGIPKNQVNGAISSVSFVKIGGSSGMLCSVKNLLFMFEDLPMNKIAFVRSFSGHVGYINGMFQINQYIISTSDAQEIFLWKQSHNVVQKKFNVDSNIILSMGIPNTDYFFIIDSDSYLHLYNVENTDSLSKINVFKMSVSSPITNVKIDEKNSIIIFGNSLGYIKVFKYSENAELVEMTMFRAHNTAIKLLAYLSTSNLLLTSDDENEVHCYNLYPPKFISKLGNPKEWKYNNPSEWLDTSEVVCISEHHFRQSGNENNIKVTEPSTKSTENPRTKSVKSNSDDPAEFITADTDKDTDDVLNMFKINDKFKEVLEGSSHCLRKPPALLSRSFKIIRPSAKRCNTYIPSLTERMDFCEGIKYIESARSIKPRSIDMSKFGYI